jgi:hypothetical protein
MNDSSLVCAYHAGIKGVLSEMIIKLITSEHVEHADTSSMKVEPGKKVNDNMVYPRLVKGKFKYYPENDDVIEHATHTFKNQFIRIRFSSFSFDPKYSEPVRKLLRLA